MALQSIGVSNRGDAFYRYKMPVMVTKVERHHNVKRTNVVNMAAIAKALARPASYIARYLGCKLAAQSCFDEKRGACFVGWAHGTAELADLLDAFVEKYVLCYECGNPETEIVVSETGSTISLECAACGSVSDVDAGDKQLVKLSSFIMKNPPGKTKKGGKDKKALGRAAGEEQMKLENGAGKKKKKGASAKESTAKGSKKKGAPAGGSDEDHPTSSPACSRDGDDAAAAEEDDDDDDDVVWQTDTSMAAVKQRMQEQLSAGTAQMVMPCTESE